MIAAICILTLAATSTYFGYAAYRLTIDYPGLNDPSPNVDGYWPAIVNLVYKIFAAISGLLAIGVAAIWVYCLHSRRTKMKRTKTQNRLCWILRQRRTRKHLTSTNNAMHTDHSFTRLGNGCISLRSWLWQTLEDKV